MRIAGWQVDLDTGVLRRGETERKLTPKSASVLCYLAQRPNELVPTDELLDQFWTGSLSADNAAQKAISEIRKALGDDPKSPTVIQTVSKRGYVFLAPDSSPDSSSAQNAETSLGSSEIPGTSKEPKHSKGLEEEQPATPVAGSTRGRVAFGAIAGLVAILVGSFVAVDRWKASASGSSSPALTSIVILPFDDMSPAGDQSWLANGMSEQLIESLARVEELQVMARTSAESVKRQGLDAVAVGQHLQVGALVEGSVRRAENELRVTVQLIDTSDGTHLWSANYDRSAGDLFDVQEEIAREIAEAIRIELGATDGFSWLQRSRYETDDVRAYELVRRGVEAEQQFTEEGFRREIELTQQALEMDGDYSQAHAQRAWGHYFLWLYRMDPRLETKAEAVRGAMRALESDPGNAAAHNLLVEIAMHEGDWAGAEIRVKKAIEMAPKVGPLRSSYSAILLNDGRTDEAIVQARRAIAIDPGASWVTLGNVLLEKGEIEKAIESYENAPEAQLRNVYSKLVYAYRLASREEEGIALLERSGEAFGVDSADLTDVYEERGYSGALSYWVDLRRGVGAQCESPVVLALVGDSEALLDCLEARKGRLGWMRLRSSPVYDDYRDLPRFRALFESSGVSVPKGNETQID